MHAMQIIRAIGTKSNAHLLHATSHSDTMNHAR
jgi:hypothetical protein